MKSEDDTDNLFGGLDDPPKSVSAGRRIKTGIEKLFILLDFEHKTYFSTKTDLMADLFGTKTEEPKSITSKKEFVLDEKYRKPAIETKEIPLSSKKNP